jgi:hypothetical protein
MTTAQHSKKPSRTRDNENDTASADYEAQKPVVSAASDEVFGDIREGGPNYRNVSYPITTLADL